MKIKVLGTSATWPLPRVGKKCHCPICTSRDPKDRRLRSSILITHNSDLNVLIDCGPDIVRQLRREKIKKIDAVLITHGHSDHISGLKKADFKKLHPGGFIPVYANLKTHQKINKNFSQKFQYQKKIIYPYKKFKIGGFAFLPLGVKHSKTFPTLAFKIISTFSPKVSKLNKSQIPSLIYIPDYKQIPQKSKKRIKNCDILILGGAILEKNIPWHNPIDCGIRLAQELQAKKVYFTHIGHWTKPHMKLVQYVKKKGGGNFSVLYDGQQISTRGGSGSG